MQIWSANETWFVCPALIFQKYEHLLTRRIFKGKVENNSVSDD